MWQIEHVKSFPSSAQCEYLGTSQKLEIVEAAEKGLQTCKMNLKSELVETFMIILISHHSAYKDCWNFAQAKKFEATNNFHLEYGFFQQIVLTDV